MGREISGVVCCTPRSGNGDWFPGCRPAPPPCCPPPGGCPGGGACWPPCCWPKHRKESVRVMIVAATARTHSILIMRYLQMGSSSPFRQPEVSALAVMIPGAGHHIALYRTIDKVMYSLAVVALRVKLHRDRAGLWFERYFRDGQISKGGA